MNYSLWNWSPIVQQQLGKKKRVALSNNLVPEPTVKGTILHQRIVPEEEVLNNFYSEHDYHYQYNKNVK